MAPAAARLRGAPLIGQSVICVIPSRAAQCQASDQSLQGARDARATQNIRIRTAGGTMTSTIQPRIQAMHAGSGVHPAAARSRIQRVMRDKYKLSQKGYDPYNTPLERPACAWSSTRKRA